jgi:hypothetical protein
MRLQPHERELVSISARSGCASACQHGASRLVSTHRAYKALACQHVSFLVVEFLHFVREAGECE